MIDYTRSKESEKLEDYGDRRGFSSEPHTGRRRLFIDLDGVVCSDNETSGFASVIVSQKPIDNRFGLKLSKTISGSFEIVGVKLYWCKIAGKDFPKTDLCILADTTITNHLGITSGYDRMRNLPTNKESQGYNFLSTVYPDRTKGQTKDDTISALAKYISARFWPNVTLQRVKYCEWNDSRLITADSFNGLSFKEITKALWHGDNLKFKNASEDVVETAQESLNADEELVSLIKSVKTKHFVKQMSTVFLAVKAVLKANPNLPGEYFGQASISRRRQLEKGTKIFSGYLNRGLKKHGFRAEITKVLLERDGIKGAEEYNGSGRGFYDPQAIRDREQYAHHLWGRFLNLARP